MLVVGARGDVRDYDQVLDTVGKEMGKVKILRPERQGTETLRLKGSSLTRMEGQRNLVSDGYAHFCQPRGEEPSALTCRKSAGRSRLGCERAIGSSGNRGARLEPRTGATFSCCLA
jgi:hypothetical protein